MTYCITLLMKCSDTCLHVHFLDIKYTLSIVFSHKLPMVKLVYIITIMVSFTITVKGNDFAIKLSYTAR